MRDAFHFSSEKNYNVSFHLGDKLFRGELVLTSGKMPYLSIIDDGTFSRIQSVCPDILVCRFGNDSFTLFSCEKKLSTIYPALIIFNLPENTNGFSCVEFSINELNVFLNDNFVSVSYEDKKFSREINNKEFEVKVECRNDIKLISNYWNSWSETTHENDMVTRFYQRNIMRIEYHDSVGVGEVKNIIFHLLNLMMMLTLVKCNLNYAWVVVDGKRYEIYFPIMIKKHKGELNFLHALIDLSRLDDEKWSLIINNSFKDELFKDFWPRFCGMLSYDSYWEYELLGFVSILDFYLAKKVPIKKGRGISSLKERYATLKNETNADVINFISLTDENFSLLVKIRNGVAHCDPEKIKLVSNFTKLSILIKKLTILLSYLSLRDLGISDAEYACHASRVFNDISRNALLKTKWLNKKLPGVRVIKIAESSYDDLKHYSSGRVNNAIFIEVDGERFNFDVDLTKVYDSSWWKNMGSYERTTDYIDSEVCLNEYSRYRSEYVDFLHVYCDGVFDDFIELRGAHFLNKYDKA